MSWKIVLTLLIILALIGILINTETGQKFVYVFKEKIENVTSILKTGQEKNFSITLTSQKEMFYNRSFKLLDSELKMSGMGQQIVVGDIKMKGDKKIGFEIKVEDGIFNYTDKGIEFVGFSNNLKIDGNEFSSEKRLRIAIEMVESQDTPLEFLLTNLVENKIAFSSFYGTLSGEKGFFKLTNDTLEIHNFNGSLQLYENKTITLIGTGEKVLINGENTII